jgi:hypothetical protein
MRSLSLLTVALAFGATTAWAQTAPGAAPAPAPMPAASAPLQLEVALRGYGADDRARSLAGDSAPDKLEGYVWADRTLCALGSGSAAPATTPWVGWHFVGTVQSIVAEGGRNAVHFRVEWQRVWESGARVTEGSNGVSSSSLREGERLELDSLSVAAAGACGTTQVRLEVGAIVRPTYRVELTNRAREMLATAGARGARGAAGGATASPTPLAGEYAKTLKTFQGRMLALPGTYDAELWLVHRNPDGTESTEPKQTVRFTGTDLPFTFPAVVVKTSKGDLTLDFSGTLRAGVGPDAKAMPGFFARGYSYGVPIPDSSRFFYFANSPEAVAGRAAAGAATAADDAVRIAVTIARRIRGGTPAIDTRGGSYFFMNVPAPTDVVSFEFPSLPNVSEDLLKGHTFSLRIRVTPVPK